MKSFSSSVFLQGFIVNGETAKQGFKATSGFDQNCYTKYQYSTKWLIHYFGEKVAGDATKPDYIILDSLLNDLQSKYFVYFSEHFKLNVGLISFR